MNKTLADHILDFIFMYKKIETINNFTHKCWHLFKKMHSYKRKKNNKYKEILT